MKYLSAYLIANNIEIEGSLPSEISDGVQLRPPTGRELRFIRQLQTSARESGMVTFFPHDMRVTVDSDGRKCITQSTDANDFRYYLVSDEHGGGKVIRLTMGLLLLDPCIEFCLRISCNRDEGSGRESAFGFSVFGGGLVERHFSGPHAIGELVALSLADIREADRICDWIDSLKPDHDFVNLSLDQWKESRRLPPHSPLQFVILFSIIESLITHPPRLNENLDSIGHQLRGKIDLLTNQVGLESLSSSGFDTNLSAKQAWKLIYGCRSAVAHGSRPDFQSEAKALKSKETTIDFLTRFTRSLLLAALQNPDLFRDLKKC